MLGWPLVRYNQWSTPSCQFITTCILRVHTLWYHPKWGVTIIQTDHMGQWGVNVGNRRSIGLNVFREEGSRVIRINFLLAS